jgi:hypothetical protein
VKPPRLSLPPEVAPLVASAQRRSDPPDGAKDRLRARLDWAFIESGPAKVVYAPEHQSLHAVPPIVMRQDRPNHWFMAIAQAAAALALGRVPLALASLGIAVAAVPVTRVLLDRVSENRTAAHEDALSRSPHRAATHAPSQAPPILVMPSLAPLPVPFPAEEPVAPTLQSVARPFPDRVTASVSAEIPSDDLALGTERQLLDRARLALVRGDALGALASLNEHGIRYPGSQLAEEREALSIQALRHAGRVGEARLRDAEFRRRFPRSLLLPALDAALHE